MSQAVTEPNTELAILLLAAGHDEKALRRHAGFATRRDARDFASRADTKAQVSQETEARAQRVGIKGLATIELMLDSDSTDGRTRVAAARTALEVAGFLRKDAMASETKLLRELSVPELSAMIEHTRSELERAEARVRVRGQPAALIASS